jgi:hypothetical protein
MLNQIIHRCKYFVALVGHIFNLSTQVSLSFTPNNVFSWVIIILTKALNVFISLLVVPIYPEMSAIVTTSSLSLNYNPTPILDYVLKYCSFDRP